MKKYGLKIITLFLLLLFFGSSVYLYLELEEERETIFNLRRKLEEEKEKEEESVIFDEEFVKNAEIDIYCPLFLEDGRVEVESLASACDDESLPDEEFRAELLFFEMDENERKAFGLLESQVGNFDSEFKIVAFDLSRGHFSSFYLEEKPLSLSLRDGIVKVDFREDEESYRLIGNNFERVVFETVRLASPGGGFSVEIPVNWKVERNGLVFRLYNPDSRELHFIEIHLNEDGEHYKLEASKNNPYDWEMELIEESIRINELSYLSDYRSFNENLETYLDLNTVREKITYFEEGEKKDYFNILAFGDPSSWSGTPGGLYEIISKEGLRFSTESAVYMPFSMRMYGKYLIHGEAYLPSGAPYQAPVSGGCVRVRNSEMEKLYDLAKEGMPLLSITHEKDPFPDKKEKAAKFPEITAESFLIADIDSGKVFADKSPSEKYPPGSLAKFMTAIITTEQMGVNTPITIRNYMINEPSPGIYNGRRITMANLLPPLLAESSDESARVLAHYLGRDSTLEKMNEKAEMIGMKNTEFVEVTGTNIDNFSTAEDLYYLLYYLINTRVPILDVTRGKWVQHVNYNAFPGLENQNIFYPDPDFLGGKTGSIEDFGETAAFLFNLDIGGESRKIAFVLLGSENRKELRREVTELKKWLQSAYSHDD